MPNNRSKNCGAVEYKKLQAPNNKQYPNYKLQKIPPLEKGETGLDLPRGIFFSLGTD
jgi:hypothetical protein